MNKRNMSVLTTGALAAALTFGGVGYAVAETATTSELASPAAMMARAGGGLLGVVADATGLDIGDVAERRVEGESLAAIAESQGVSTADLKDAAVVEYEASLDERLASTDAMSEGMRPGMGQGSDGMSPEGVLADMTELELSEIQAQREDGTSLAQIAAAEGVDIDVVIDEVLENVEEGLQVGVDEGRLTEDGAEEILTMMESRLDEMVDSTEAPPERGDRGPFGGSSAMTDGGE